MIGSAEYSNSSNLIRVYSTKLTYPAAGGNSTYNVTAVLVDLTYTQGARNTLSLQSGSGPNFSNVVLNILSDGTYFYRYLARIYGRRL